MLNHYTCFVKKASDTLVLEALATSMLKDIFVCLLLTRLELLACFVFRFLPSFLVLCFLSVLDHQNHPKCYKLYEKFREVV